MTEVIEYRELTFAPGYRVGSDGSVWTRKNARWGLRAEWRRMKATPNSDGYPGLSLMLPSKKAKRFHVNVLVLLAFVGPRPGRMDSCHKNGIPGDCRRSNLYWGTRKQNVADALRHGRMRVGSRSNLAKLDEERIALIRSSQETGRALALRYGMSEGAISMIRSRKVWKHVP